MERPSFPAAIDNTIRSAFKACERKGFMRFLLEYNSPYPSVHLHAGGAFAKGMEVTRKAYFKEGASAEDAVASGWAALVAEYGDFNSDMVPNKSRDRMGEALISYFDEYPLETDSIKPAMFNGEPAVEFNFGIPLPIEHPETGDPLIYCGRFDMLGEANGQLFVVDEKTTGSLGNYWARRYELSAQFTGYCWAARQHGYPVVGAIIRGIGILSKEIKHAGMPLMREDFMIEEWYIQLLKDVQRMVDRYKATDWSAMQQPAFMLGSPWGVWQPDYNDACGSYGGCDFLAVCGIAPVSRTKLLEINFVKRKWEPLKGLDDAQ